MLEKSSEIQFISFTNCNSVLLTFYKIYIMVKSSVKLGAKVANKFNIMAFSNTFFFIFQINDKKAKEVTAVVVPLHVAFYKLSCNH